ncbi:MAG: alkaline phosphatase family protein [Chloroflexota bacterium]
MIRKFYRIALMILLCLMLAASAGSWAFGLMDSFYAYRSPLHDSPPKAGERLGAALNRQTVFVLIDGLRLDTSLDLEVMPTLNALRQRGAWATVHSKAPSYSQPGYTVLMSGAWPDISDGPTINAAYEHIPFWTQDNIFSAAQRAGLKTAVSGYYWFGKLIPPEALDESFYTPSEDHAADLDVMEAALPWLSDASYDFVLIHIDQLDYAGHYEGGPLDPRWGAAARRVDDMLREIADSLDLSKDTLIVTSDHGHIDQGGHGGSDHHTLLEPFVMAGASVRPGAYPDLQMVDIAPTIAALLGTNIPAANQGHVMSEMLVISPVYEQKIQAAIDYQQAQLLDNYQKAIGYEAALLPGDDPVEMHQDALNKARDSRLRTERWPRFSLVLVLLLCAMIILRQARSKNLIWHFAAAGLYYLIFNLRYGLIDQRAYSISSMLYPEDLIIYTTNTTIIALSAAWLATAFMEGMFRKTAIQAAESTLGKTLAILSLLVLPVLWHYAWYGVLVGWSLPDINSIYLAFLALVQIIFVVIFGLFFSGLAAFITRLIPVGKMPAKSKTRKNR